MALKVVGYLSTKTGKVYGKKSTAKGVDTKVANAEYANKLESLKAKFRKG